MKPTTMFAFLAAIAGLACGDSTSPQFGQPMKMVALADIGEMAVSGQPVSVNPSVLVTDAENRPVPGLAVTFSIVSGGGSLTGATQTTNASGIATLGAWTIGPSFGIKTLRASAGSLPAIAFTIRGIAPDDGVLAFDVADPEGDTIAHTGTKTPPVDLLRIRGDFKRDSLIITMTFGAPVRPGSADAANSIGGEIELDMDDDLLTGYKPADSNKYGTSADLGVDYVVDLFDSSPTGLFVFSALGMARALISYPDNSIILRFPLSMLGDDDGNFSLVTVVGPYVWASDVFPNTGHLAVRRDIDATSAIVDRSMMLRPSVSRLRVDWTPRRLPGW
jgi:hypothetical protein